MAGAIWLLAVSYSPGPGCSCQFQKCCYCCRCIHDCWSQPTHALASLPMLCCFKATHPTHNIMDDTTAVKLCSDHWQVVQCHLLAALRMHLQLVAPNITTALSTICSLRPNQPVQHHDTSHAIKKSVCFVCGHCAALSTSWCTGCRAVTIHVESTMLYRVHSRTTPS
jgi:hypothetical protein